MHWTILFSENVTDLSVYFKEAFQRIRSDAEDVKSNMESGSTLKIGRKAVQPLVELKNLAAEVFSNVTNNEVKYLYQVTLSIQNTVNLVQYLEIHTINSYCLWI